MVDRDRVKGAARNLAGKAKTAIGKATGDEKLKAEGRTDKIVGKAQNIVGGLRDKQREKREERRTR